MGNSDSKAVFTDRLNGLPSKRSAISTDISFWESLLSLPVTVEDVFEVVTPSYIRSLRQDRPETIVTLLAAINEHMLAILNSGTITPKDVTKLRTCIRLLTRVIPFVLEDPEDQTVSHMMWRHEPSEEMRPLAESLLFTINRTFFLPGFTIAAGCPAQDPLNLPTDRIDPHSLWLSGIGGLPDQTLPVSDCTDNRIECVRCLLTMLSGALFQTVEEYKRSPSQMLPFFCSGDVPFTANLFCSLAALVLRYDPVGYGIPYGSVFASEKTEELIETAFQLLCVLVDYEPSVFDEKETEEKPRNVFRIILAGLNKTEELDLIVRGTVNLLETVYTANTTVLPGSMKSITFYQESLIFFWHCIINNRGILTRAVTTASARMKIMVAVLNLLVESKDSPAKVGLVHMCAFVLLVMSAERDFAVALNEPYAHYSSIALTAFEGSHADLLLIAVLTFVSEVMAGQYRQGNESLIDMLLSIVSNVTPFVKRLSLEACVKVGALMEKLSRPTALLSRKHSFTPLILLFEAVNNVIQYQAEGNSQMVYNAMRLGQVLDRITSLTLPEGEGPSWRTIEWLDEQKTKVPTSTCSALVTKLLPQIEAECEANEITDPDEVVVLLNKHTLVGLIPPPHTIVSRGYVPGSSYTVLWFTSYLWGVVFTRSQALPLYDWKKIRLILITATSTG